jgi:hypothetical protein
MPKIVGSWRTSAKGSGRNAILSQICRRSKRWTVPEHPWTWYREWQAFHRKSERRSMQSQTRMYWLKTNRAFVRRDQSLWIDIERTWLFSQPLRDRRYAPVELNYGFCLRKDKNIFNDRGNSASFRVEAESRNCYGSVRLRTVLVEKRRSSRGLSAAGEWDNSEFVQI